MWGDFSFKCTSVLKKMDDCCGKYCVARINIFTHAMNESFFKKKFNKQAFLCWCGALSPTPLLMSPPSLSSFRFLDTSKQAIGMLFIHFANVYLSDLTEEDPCSLWVCVLGAVIVVVRYCVLSHAACFVARYLINFLLDATLGMLVIYGGVKAVSAVVEWRQWDSLRFGEYGKEWLFFCFCFFFPVYYYCSLINYIFKPWKLLLLNPL